MSQQRPGMRAIGIRHRRGFARVKPPFGQPPEEIFLSGGLAKSESFFDAMKQHLAQGIARWEPSDGLSGEFAVAYGLALRSN